MTVTKPCFQGTAYSVGICLTPTCPSPLNWLVDDSFSQGRWGSATVHLFRGQGEWREKIKGKSVLVPATVTSTPHGLHWIVSKTHLAGGSTLRSSMSHRSLTCSCFLICKVSYWSSVVCYPQEVLRTRYIMYEKENVRRYSSTLVKQTWLVSTSPILSAHPSHSAVEATPQGSFAELSSRGPAGNLEINKFQGHWKHAVTHS